MAFEWANQDEFLAGPCKPEKAVFRNRGAGIHGTGQSERSIFSLGAGPALEVKDWEPEPWEPVPDNTQNRPFPSHVMPRELIVAPG